MTLKQIGVVVLILGIIMMVYTGFNYVTTERIVDIGDLHIDKKESHPVRWSPILGGVLLVVGLVMVFMGPKK
jgi:uncharacterized membrane protein YidH (DUF202 family)